jgi:hypothetical protein
MLLQNGVALYLDVIDKSIGRSPSDDGNLALKFTPRQK